MDQPIDGRDGHDLVREDLVPAAGRLVDGFRSTKASGHYPEQSSRTRFLTLSHGNNYIVECVDGPSKVLDQAEGYYTTQEGWRRL
jgi:hypothetical protein